MKTPVNPSFFCTTPIIVRLSQDSYRWKNNRTGHNVTMTSTEKREMFTDGEYVGNIPGTASIGKQRTQIIKGENK